MAIGSLAYPISRLDIPEFLKSNTLVAAVGLRRDHLSFWIDLGEQRKYPMSL